MVTDGADKSYDNSLGNLITPSKLNTLSAYSNDGTTSSGASSLESTSNKPMQMDGLREEYLLSKSSKTAPGPDLFPPTRVGATERLVSTSVSMAQFPVCELDFGEDEMFNDVLKQQPGDNAIAQTQIGRDLDLDSASDDRGLWSMPGNEDIKQTVDHALDRLKNKQLEFTNVG